MVRQDANLSKQPPSFFPTTALDHAVAGLGAGAFTVLCIHPLDLLRIRLQVSTTKPKGTLGIHIWHFAKDIQHSQGWKGLYRGIGPNLWATSASWGSYFLFYNMLKKRAAHGDVTKSLSSGMYLICALQASAASAALSNPFYLVRLRMCTTCKDTPGVYRGLWDGLARIIKSDGAKGLFRGTSLALFGVTTGAVQFMVYENLKKWGFDRKKRQYKEAGKEWTIEVDKLSNVAYTVMSIISKLTAMASTYPYQVVRSRIQDPLMKASFPTIPATIRRTWSREGVRGFYRGLGTGLIQVLPKTCITFVVYENLAWLLRATAARRDGWR